MKTTIPGIRSLRGILHALALALAVLVLIPAAAHAATRTKQNNTDNLNLATSWDTLPGAADIAQWTSTVAAGNTTASLGADLSWAGLKIVSPGGLVTINSGNTLTVGSSGIDLSAATQNLTLNCGLTLLGKQSWTAAASRTLNVAGTFTRTGSTVDFTSFNATATLSGIANDGTTGILGPWATTGSGTSMNYVKSTAGAISAYTGQTASAIADLSDVNSAGVNYSFNPGTGTATLSAPITANTLLYKGTGSGSAIVNNSPNRITVNGLLGQGTGRYIISGTGNLMIGANKELVCNYNIGFSSIVCPIVDYNDGTTTYPSSVTISVASTVAEWSFGASGVNATYSGGTTLNLPTANGTMCNFYSNSFGTGPITVNGPGMIKNLGSLANSLTLNGGAGLRNGGTYSGPVTVNGGSYLSLNGNNVTISGNVSGPGGWSVNGTATLTNNSALLSGVNTYTGPTTVNNGTLKAGRASMANVSGAFGLNSAVTMANSATARIDLNSFDTQIGSLTGGGTTGGNVINSHATITATLTVGADNTNPAAYAGLISGSRLALCKIGTGKQILSGANTYTGDTVVQNGTLSLSPTVAGGYLADTADVKLYTGGILELNTGSTDTIRSLYIDGVGQVTGTWGGTSSSATNKTSLITGSGMLNVGTLGGTLTYSISGTVMLNNGTGLAGVTVSDGTRSATTASNGTYTISAVPDNATYTVTASLGGYTLTPSSVAVTVKGTNVTGNNYTAAVVAGSITLTGPLGAVNTTYGTASATPTSFTVSGTGLTPAAGNLTVAPPSGYEVSLSSGSGYTTSLSVPYTGSTLASTTVYVRLAATAGVGSSPYSGTISVSGGGATVQTIATASSTVSAATLTITANNQNKPFGTTQTTPVTGSTAFTAVGLQNGDTVGTVTLTYGSGGLLDTDPVGSTSTITPSAATGGTFTAGNYSITYTPDSGTLTVIPVPVITLGGTLAAVDTTYGTASASPTSFTVTGSALTPAAGDLTVTPPSGYEVSSGSGYAPTLLLPYTGSALSSTTVSVRLAATTAVNGGAGYAGDITIAGGSASQTIATASSTVAKATATVVVAPYTVTYNGAPHSATVTSITGVNGQTGATVGTVILSTTHTAAGTYGSDSWSFTGTANYNNIGSTTITNTIDKATATVVVTPYTVAYDGAPHSATVTSITGVNGETGATVGTVTLPAAHTNAGTYNTDAWSFTGTANYNDIGSTTITNTINKATLTEAPSTINLSSATGVFLGDTVAGADGTLATVYTGNNSAPNWYAGTWSYLTDGVTSTKWLGTGTQGWGPYPGTAGKGAGFYFTLPAAATMQTIRFFTEDSSPGRSPATMTIEGSNAGDPLLGTSWTLVYSGAAGLATTPNNSAGETVSFTNATAYTRYRVLFPTVYSPAGAGGVQLAGIVATTGGGLAATPIIEGQALSDSTLSGTFKNAAGTTVSGALTFDSPTTTPAAGIYSAAVSFTPADADNYHIWTGSVSVTVAAAYSVTYDANGASSGTVPIDANTYAPAATVTVLGNTGSLAKTGYTFTGWNSAADGTGTHYGATFAMGSSSVTLYAEWKTPYEAWLDGETATDENLKEFAFGTTNTGVLVLNGDGTIHTRGQAPIVQTTVGSSVVQLTYARLKNSGCTYAAQFSSNLNVWLASDDASLIYPPDVPTEVVVDNGDDMEVVSVKFPIFRDNGGSFEKMEQNFSRITVTTN